MASWVPLSPPRFRYAIALFAFNALSPSALLGDGGPLWPATTLPRVMASATAPTSGRAGRCRLALAGWPLTVAPCRRTAGNRPLQPYHGRHNPLLLAAAPAALAAADSPCNPCRWPGHGRSPLKRAWPWPVAPFPHCLHYENATRIRRMIVRDSISSHAI
ncbi:hypothetical protein B296_00013064 [Ensete ventricosum]|uniref:Uncharacterized protein n=1 Tax=Ensete ventricosum TaxID=4639 RepID=A0A426Y8H3_ENSVE|nr:hypothetical protein B296_00013064 [Ensete ventricosum]